MALRAAAKRKAGSPVLGYVYVFDKHSHYSILRLFHRREYTEKAQNTKRAYTNTLTTTESLKKMRHKSQNKTNVTHQKKKKKISIEFMTCVAQGIPVAGKYLQYGHGHFHQGCVQS